MNVVDSSGWLEYFAAGPNASFFAPALERNRDLIVPSLSLSEVFKRVLRQRGETDALQAVALMLQGRVVDLDASTAISAARLGFAHGLALADSVILATAHAFGATLWTQDADFQGFPGVEYRAARAAR
jgi:predicted nucleic acid-binding protein